MGRIGRLYLLLNRTNIGHWLDCYFRHWSRILQSVLVCRLICLNDSQDSSSACICPAEGSVAPLLLLLVSGVRSAAKQDWFEYLFNVQAWGKILLSTYMRLLYLKAFANICKRVGCINNYKILIWKVWSGNSSIDNLHLKYKFHAQITMVGYLQILKCKVVNIFIINYWLVSVIDPGLVIFTIEDTSQTACLDICSQHLCIIPFWLVPIFTARKCSEVLITIY